MTFANASAIRRAFENAGVELIDENGGGPGARLTQRLSNQTVRRGANLTSNLDDNGGSRVRLQKRQRKRD